MSDNDTPNREGQQDGIVVGGDRFGVEHIGRDRYLSSFVLNIHLDNRHEVDIGLQRLRRPLGRGSRSDITDELIQEELEKFQEKFPNAEIKQFGVVEETTAREGEKINHD